ncbi:MAG: DUF4174 domain-containing protein [Pararhodobacter sp.]
MTLMMKPILFAAPFPALALALAMTLLVPSAHAQQSAISGQTPGRAGDSVEATAEGVAPNTAATEDTTEDATENALEGAIDDEAQAGLRILDAAGLDLDDFLWEWRILAIMADTPNDPAFVRQMREIAERTEDLFERDVVVIIDSDRNSGSVLRQRLRPRGFMLAIIDKDGEVKQRRPAPRDVREISAVIDRFPLRRQEILERRPAGR